MTTINMEGLRELTDEELELVAGGHTRSIDPNPPIGPIYPIPPLNPVVGPVLHIKTPVV